MIREVDLLVIYFCYEKEEFLCSNFSQVEIDEIF